MNKIVIKLTGHLFKSSSIDPSMFQLVNFIKTDYANNRRIYYIVVGGGPYSRLLIENLRKQGVNEYFLDEIGIAVTRVHALFIMNLLRPYVHETIPITIEEAAELANEKPINLVMGGVKPGFSTNAVSVMLAKKVNADVLITMSRSGGLYSADPEKDPNAKLLKAVKVSDIEYYLDTRNEKAGSYPLLDKTSINLLKKYKLRMYIAPPQVDSIIKIINGENPGTEIIH